LPDQIPVQSSYVYSVPTWYWRYSQVTLDSANIYCYGFLLKRLVASFI